MAFGGFSPPQGITTTTGAVTLNGALIVSTGGITVSAGQILAASGTAAAPGWAFSSEASTGSRWLSAGVVRFVLPGTDRFIFASDAFSILNNSAYLAFGNSSDAILGREAAAILQMGADVNGAAVAQTLKAHAGITGTDIAGAGITFAAGRGTGAGGGATLALSTATTLGTGTTAQTLVARLTLSKGAVTTDASTLTFADALDMVFSATTGTKIGTAGTQKLGFYGAAPTIQLTGVAVSAAGIHAALVTLGLITA